MPIVVDRIVLNPQYGSNCYVLRAADGAAEAAIVDPGGEPGPLREALNRMGAAAGGILITHCDVDHVTGVAGLAAGTGAEVWAPAGEADALRRGETRGGMQVDAHEPEHVVEGGERLTVAGIDFEVVAVPGHSAGHVAFCVEDMVFSGDLLFAGSVGRVDFPGGDWEALLDSIRGLIERFGPDAVVHPGHGGPTTLGRELETNPFLGELRRPTSA